MCLRNVIGVIGVRVTWSYLWGFNGILYSFCSIHFTFSYNKHSSWLFVPGVRATGSYIWTPTPDLLYCIVITLSCNDGLFFLFVPGVRVTRSHLWAPTPARAAKSRSQASPWHVYSLWHHGRAAETRSGCHGTVTREDTIRDGTYCQRGAPRGAAAQNYPSLHLYSSQVGHPYISIIKLFEFHDKKAVPWSSTSREIVV